MVMFLGSEAMLFGAFFTAFFFLRFTSATWPTDGITLPVEATGINTAILISSSFTMHWALVSVRRNSRFGLVLGLGLTLVMGVTFLALQIHEYVTLGFTPSTNAFSGAFFALTGLHGFHVMIGATLLTIAFYASLPRALLLRLPPRPRSHRPLLALRRRGLDSALHGRLPPVGASGVKNGARHRFHSPDELHRCRAS